MRLIKAVTIEDHPRIVYIPRMRFKFKLKYASSFSMTRTQFPLRLCYAMSVNKSQGQSFTQCLFDTTMNSFSHGHLYVALSRMRRYDQLRLILTDDMICRDYIDQATHLPVPIVPMVVNIVYPSVIQRPPVILGVD